MNIQLIFGLAADYMEIHRNRDICIYHKSGVPATIENKNSHEILVHKLIGFGHLFLFFCAVVKGHIQNNWKYYF